MMNRLGRRNAMRNEEAGGLSKQKGLSLSKMESDK